MHQQGQHVQHTASCKRVLAGVATSLFVELVVLAWGRLVRRYRTLLVAGDAES